MSAKKKAGKAVGIKITPKPPTKKKTKTFEDFDTPQTKKKLSDMSKPPSQRKMDATGTPTKKKKATTKKRPVIKQPSSPAPTKMSTKEKVQIGGMYTGLGALGVGAMLNRSKKIKAGDTLSQIAKKNKMSLKQLLKYNPNIKDPNKIRVGQTIKLPGTLGRALGVKGKKTKNPYEGMTKSEMAKMAMPKKKKGGTVFRRGGGKALRGFGKATYSNKMY
tara:strand:- start:18 stop:671 length:654 start_codon:yes stop_codon:yes gene_type:complete